MRLPVHSLARLLAWSLRRDPFTGRRPITAALPFLGVTIAVGAYQTVAVGRFDGATLFLALAAGAMMVAVTELWNAARSLYRDPPGVEVAVTSGRRRKELEREKTSLVKALKELEFDHEMRKVSDVDFAEIGGVYRGRTIRVMRQLDDQQLDYARLVEEELARYKKGAPVGVASGSSPSPSASPSPAPDVHLCGNCATVNDRDAVFCKKCATRLVTEVSA